jgi:hypothetical protein
MKPTVDLVVVWFRTSTNVRWVPLIADDEQHAETLREDLRKRYHGQGGVESYVSTYARIDKRKE